MHPIVVGLVGVHGLLAVGAALDLFDVLAMECQRQAEGAGLERRLAEAQKPERELGAVDGQVDFGVEAGRARVNLDLLSRWRMPRARPAPSPTTRR